MGRSHKNIDWDVPESSTGTVESWNFVPICILMDIRDQLMELNALLHCRNFTDIPNILRRIRRNTYKKGKVRR